MKFFITGGTGFIGKHLTRLLIDNGYKAVIATRDPERFLSDVNGNTAGNEGIEDDQQNVRYVRLQEDMSEDMQGCRIVINLAGESLIGKRWTSRVKKKLYDSRIHTTRYLVKGMSKMDPKPDVFLSASGVNYYGDYGDEIITEENEKGEGFLADICRDWELEAREAEALGVRVVNHRFAVALGTDGGALKTMLTAFKSFVGGAIGPGDQYFPWIHIDDLCRSLLFAISSDKLEGPVNTSSPNPVTMNDFSAALGKVLSRPSMFHVPEMAVRLALGEAASMLTDSLRVVPEKLQQNSFTFDHPTVEKALADLLRK